MQCLWKRLENSRGQVAIFVALIFQVLFLFFAMIVNVGLLVHHKINLQNSVDLAAYYGAMKQAESMNAIAHINYQVRQSWKLLAWRYRTIGNGGVTEDGRPTYNKGLKEVVDALETSQLDPSTEAPAFCAAYAPFNEVPTNQSVCKSSLQATTIRLFGIPPQTGIVGISRVLRAAAFAGLNKILGECTGIGPFNWLLLARFKVAFVIDTGSRKRVINMLANGLSGQGSGTPTEDFKELDGSSASVGIRNTLEKNLTIQNRNSIRQFKIYNSLGNSNCGVTNPSFERPPKWLAEIPIKPSFSTSETDCSGVITGSSESGAWRTQALNIEDPDPSKPNYWQQKPEISEEIAALRPFVNYSHPPFDTTLGMEKNPWCMAYVGVKASTKPRIPFMPFGDVTLTASAYAKPFGGRIGPWFQEAWAPGVGSSQSNIGNRLDEMTPARFVAGNNINAAAQRDPTRVPNYARFPGDIKGLRSRALSGIYTRALFHMSKKWAPFNDITLNSSVVPAGADNSPSFSHWSEIAKNFTDGNPAKDIMAWNNDTKKASQMRLLELSAIAPDIFDTTYYSVDPNFYQVYYKKIEEHKKAIGANNLEVPSDLGARIGDAALESFNVKKQIQVQKEVLDIIDPASRGAHLQYLLKDADQLLTSWAPNSLLEYDFAPNAFGKCPSPDYRPTEINPIPGDCIAGGRTGFSVKLVSGDYLHRSDLQLGGKASPGPINNPPPDDF